MPIEVQKRDGGPERQVAAGCCVSTPVLGAVAARWEPGLFPSRWANLVVGWAVKHYRKYGAAPGSQVSSYFDEWSEAGRDPDIVKLVEQFLVALSDEAERLARTASPDHLIDLAGRVFNRHRADQLRRAIEADLDGGDSDKALARIDEFRKLELGTGAGVRVMKEPEAIDHAFASRGKALVEYPDGLGGFFKTALARDSFVAFQGREKIGKSYWLLDVAYRAVCQERNVAYFECGDLSQAQVLRRFAVRAAGRPLDGEVGHYPVSFDPLPDGKTEVRPRREEFDGPLTADEANVALRRLAKKVGGERLVVSCHPNSTLTVAAADQTLDGWERDGWAADLVIFDYADILAPPDKKLDRRDQINETWKAMRALSQKRHCLVLTATQADADSYDVTTQTLQNFSEDKRKYAHVTGMVGINQTDREKGNGVYRLNWLVLRELEFDPKHCVYTAGNLAYANPAVLSAFG